MFELAVGRLRRHQMQISPDGELGISAHAGYEILHVYLTPSGQGFEASMQADGLRLARAELSRDSRTEQRIALECAGGLQTTPIQAQRLLRNADSSSAAVGAKWIHCLTASGYVAVATSVASWPLHRRRQRRRRRCRPQRSAANERRLGNRARVGPSTAGVGTRPDAVLRRLGTGDPDGGQDESVCLATFSRCGPPARGKKESDLLPSDVFVRRPCRVACESPPPIFSQQFVPTHSQTPPAPRRPNPDLLLIFASLPCQNLDCISARAPSLSWGRHGPTLGLRELPSYYTERYFAATDCLASHRTHSDTSISLHTHHHGRRS